MAGEERCQSEPFKHLGGDGLTYCHEVHRSKHFKTHLKVPELKFVFYHRKFTDIFPKLFKFQLLETINYLILLQNFNILHVHVILFYDDGLGSFAI